MARRTSAPAVSGRAEDERGVMAEDLAVTVHLDAPLGPLHRELQRAVDRVAYGLNATLNKSAAIVLPGVMFHVVASESYRLGLDDAREDFPTWILACGFRDAVETVSGYLEGTRSVAAALAFGPSPGVSRETFDAAVNRHGPAGEAFRKLNFPDKVRVLNTDYGIAAAVDTEVLTINRARACLVHRGGIVAARPDCDATGALWLRWITARPVVRDGTGERPLTVGDDIRAGAEIFMRIERAERRFAPGDRVAVTAEDFMGVAFTIMTFAGQLSSSLRRFADARGLTPPPVIAKDPEEPAE
jgi:hypothetical protein